MRSVVASAEPDGHGRCGANQRRDTVRISGTSGCDGRGAVVVGIVMGMSVSAHGQCVPGRDPHEGSQEAIGVGGEGKLCEIVF